MRVPDFRAERVRGDLKDTTSDRLGASVGMELTMTARGGDERLGRRRGLDHLHPDGGLQGGEVFGGLANVVVRRSPRDRTHARVVLARARLVVRHLSDQVLGGHAGDVGGFRVALAGHQMARAARHGDSGIASH